MTGASTANEQDSGLVCAHKAHMISVYKDNDGWIESTEVAEDTWIHVEAPTEPDLKWLGQETAVPDSFLRAALDPREVARTHSYQDSQLVIVRVPYDFGRDVRIPIRTVPLAMIVSADHFITICRRPIDFVRDLNYAYDEGELKTHRGGRMILAILEVVAERFLYYLEETDRRLEEIEDRLKDSIENSEMLELLRYEKCLVYLKTGLTWNDQMVEHLRGRDQFGWDERDLELFDEVRVEYRQGHQMAETMLSVLNAVTDAYASLISNNLNVVMKFLAAMTIILTVPMVIASVYGMNVALPGETWPLMYLPLIGISVLGAVLVGLWFYRRGWLSFDWRADRRRR